jgi:hypothetical protein
VGVLALLSGGMGRWDSDDEEEKVLKQQQKEAEKKIQ